MRLKEPALYALKRDCRDVVEQIDEYHFGGGTDDDQTYELRFELRYLRTTIESALDALDALKQ